MQTDPQAWLKIQNQISKNPILLYMKGSPDFPMCGFSAKVVHILNALKVKYAYVNVLDHPAIRSTLPIYANWPTFPQLYVAGELVGGCDIISDLYNHQQDELLVLFKRLPDVFSNETADLNSEEFYKIAEE